VDESRMVKYIILLLFLALPIFGFVVFRQYRKELLLTLISFVFTFFALEIFMSVFYPQVMEHDQMFEYDQTLGWRFIANKKSTYVATDIQHHWVQTNSLGFRDREIPIANGERKKILVLGDSFVSNLAVKDDEVFTELMEQRLKNTDVLNFGVNGYGQVQEYLLLKKWLDQVNPDVVVLMIYIRNDFIDNIGGYWFHPRPYAAWNANGSEMTIHSLSGDLPARESFKSSFWSFYKKSNLYWFLNERLNILIRKYLHSDQYTPPELYLCDTEPSQKTVLMYRTMEALLNKIAILVKARHVPLIFAVAPSRVQVDNGVWTSVIKNNQAEKFNRALPDQKLMIWAEKHHWRMVDLLPGLRKEASSRQLYNPVEQHWNKGGNEVVATSIIQYLNSVRILKH